MAALALAALLSACAGAPRDVSLPIDDPNEATNKKVFAFNQAILHPPATVIKALPAPLIDRLRDVDSNLKEPRIFANDILQGRLNAAGITLARFVFNSTFGLGGLFDVAGRGGLPKQTGDFGQTLFVWGVPAGTYAVSPYFGPGTQRDVVGGTVDLAADPVGWSLGFIGWGAGAAAGGLGATVRLGQLKEAEDASIDFYSFLRSDYYQLRRADLREALGMPAVTESPATMSPAGSK
ncbi:phospholipid-binding lipoprotein MlaA [Roseiarcus fermentans]|uniref:Phospholipid-binding lipoprotein MlaA n=2 Tax=Roseiarcus fermentans TaxID=1473586 RepID=A0A366FEN4_9HYPH|nr:phospholipid-binding lipoprotein MlaA [Roseiarcus fermentans]